MDALVSKLRCPTIQPELRGFVINYDGPHTRCPGCSRSNWLIGRTLAECGFCATALPLIESSRNANATPAIIRHKNQQDLPWAA